MNFMLQLVQSGAPAVQRILPYLSTIPPPAQAPQVDVQPWFRVRLGSATWAPGFTEAHQDCGAMVVALSYCYAAACGCQQIEIDGEMLLRAVAATICARASARALERARSPDADDHVRDPPANTVLMERHSTNTLVFRQFWSYQRAPRRAHP